MQPKRLFLGTILMATVLAGPAAAEKWKVDTAHTEVKFSVNHFFTPVTGRFEDFEVDLDYNEQDPSQSRLGAKIKVGNVNTGNDRRDRHLRSDDWFDGKRHPYMTFESTSVRQVGEQLIARGNLTIKGQTQEAVLPIALLGRQEIPETMQGMLGGAEVVASFQTTAVVDRNDYGVGVGSWAATTVVGSDVQIEILLEAHRK